MARILGLLTIAGLALIVLGFVVEGMNVASPPFFFGLSSKGDLP
jgi:hypothetical protein